MDIQKFAICDSCKSPIIAPDHDGFIVHGGISTAHVELPFHFLIGGPPTTKGKTYPVVTNCVVNVDDRSSCELPTHAYHKSCFMKMLNLADIGIRK